MTAKQREARQAQLKSAMVGLIQDTRFQQFIDLLRDHREAAVRDSCTDAVVKCQRLSMAAVGEIKTYTNIIDTNDEFIAQAEEGKLQEHAKQ